MKHQIIIFTVSFLIMASCNTKEVDNPETWDKEELSEWFSKEEWKHGFEASPDDSLSQREMAIRYHRNPERWEKAFSFLARQNLENLDTGRHELDGDNLYAVISEYIPADVDSARFEAHRIYADIQYVISGQELISIAPIDDLVITSPYDEETDVMFLAAAKSDDRIASPEKFFVFFPSNAHRPSVKVQPGDSTLVKKIVVKVKLE